MIHTVKGFSIVNEAEVDVLFPEFSCLFYDTADVDILISDYSDFSKSSLYIWKVSHHVLLKPSLKDFEHYLANMRNGCNCMVILMFFGIAILFFVVVEGLLLYRILLFSVRPQHESAIGIDVFPLF